MRYILYCILLSSSLHTFGQDLFSLEKSKYYANYLFTAEDYRQAITEYERVYFFEPTDSTLSKLLVCYRYTKQYEKGIERYQNSRSIRKILLPKVFDEYNKLLLESGHFELLTIELSQNKQLADSTISNTKLKANLLQGKWNSANLALSGMKSEDVFYQNAQKTVNRGLALKYKSVPKAVLLSAIIPGAGKAYANNWKDGLFSLLLTAGAGYQGFRAFKKLGPQSLLGYAYTGIGVGFYIGNLVGTAKETKKRNKIAYEKIQNDTRQLIFSD
jgi:tetratricopeptide (TPR) repeat protein